MSRTLLRRTPPATAVAVALLAGAAGLALADAPPPPQGVVSLNASATVEVAEDLLTVVMSVTRDGADAALVQSQLKQALDAALAEARRAARPGQLEVQTGNFTLHPRYDPNSRITAWQGSTELRLEGRDMQAIGALAGRIGTMTVARVAHGLSREAREKAEGEVAAQAIARFRAKAADYARAFGYGGYALREVSVSAADTPPPMPMLRASAMAARGNEALPVEAGKGTVSITVSGTIQLTK